MSVTPTYWDTYAALTRNGVPDVPDLGLGATSAPRPGVAARNGVPDVPEPETRELLTADHGVPDVPDSRQGGAAVLDAVSECLSRFVAYPSVHALTAHVLWCAHAWLIDAWDSTPRLAFLSPEPGSGKSRALEVTEHLVPKPVHAVNVSPAYLFRKVGEKPGKKPTILFDEIDTVFGPKAKDNEDLRGLLNAGHRKGAVAGRCVVRGKEIFTEELPAYAAAALAGLNDLPDTLMSRSIVIRMRRRAANEQILPWRNRINAPAVQQIGARLAAWTAEVEYLAETCYPQMPSGVTDRAADIWEPIIAVADLAGGEWPGRAREAACYFVAEAAQRPQSLGVQLLSDLRDVFAVRPGEFREFVPTAELLAALIALPESPWADLRGKPLNDRSLAHRLAAYGIKPTQQRHDGKPVRGYRATDFTETWNRYLAPPPPPEPVQP